MHMLRNFHLQGCSRYVFRRLRLAVSICLFHVHLVLHPPTCIMQIQIYKRTKPIPPHANPEPYRILLLLDLMT